MPEERYISGPELSKELESLRKRVRQLEALAKKHQLDESLLQMEETLTQKEAMYRALFDNMSSGVAVYEAVNEGEDFIIKDFNKAGEKIENVRRENIIGRKVTEVFPGVKEFGIFQVFKRVWRTGKPERHPIALYKDNRSKGWRDNYVYKLPTGEVVAVYNDVTEQKQAEEKIKASLKEKELLLKEIHHRVKNNMAVINSLLALQAKTIDDPRLMNALKSSQNRILSMALVHEKLYKAEDLSKINFAHYIRELVAYIVQSVNMNSKVKVPVTVAADNIFLGIDLSVPCGLIINELISNALKHAFPLEQKGEIAVTMERIEKQGDFYRLIVRDNGVGLSENINIRDPSCFGLQLVHLLAQQLEGTIEISRQEGTQITLTFPI